MAQYGMLIDYEFCSGCHTCELACQQENNLKPDELGIEVRQIGPFQLGKKWQLDYFVSLTDFCTGCKDRIAKGKLPSCVHHCQSGVLEVGPIEELAKKVTGKKKMLITMK